MCCTSSWTLKNQHLTISKLSFKISVNTASHLSSRAINWGWHHLLQLWSFKMYCIRAWGYLYNNKKKLSVTTHQFENSNYSMLCRKQRMVTFLLYAVIYLQTKLLKRQFWLSSFCFWILSFVILILFFWRGGWGFFVLHFQLLRQ